MARLETTNQLDKMGREHLRRRKNLDEGSELKRELGMFQVEAKCAGGGGGAGTGRQGGREQRGVGCGEGVCKEVSDERSLRPT